MTQFSNNLASEDHRALATFFADALLASGVILSALAGPPLSPPRLPRATAWGFFRLADGGSPSTSKRAISCARSFESFGSFFGFIMVPVSHDGKTERYKAWGWPKSRKSENEPLPALAPAWVRPRKAHTMKSDVCATRGHLTPLLSGHLGWRRDRFSCRRQCATRDNLALHAAFFAAFSSNS